MSAYREQQTQFKDEKLLVECLRAVFSEVQLHSLAVQLEGYRGDKRSQTAEIVIPRRRGSASNDIGFKRQADGSFAAIISEYDSHTYGAEFMRKLKLSYTESFYKKQAAKAGLRTISRKSADGKLRIQFIKQ